MKILSKVKNKYLSLCIATTGLISGSAMAVDGTASNLTDLSQLTDAINFDGVSIAIIAIGGTLATLYAGYAGVRFVLRIVKGA